MRCTIRQCSLWSSLANSCPRKHRNKPEILRSIGYWIWLANCCQFPGEAVPYDIVAIRPSCWWLTLNSYGNEAARKRVSLALDSHVTRLFMLNGIDLDTKWCLCSCMPITSGGVLPLLDLDIWATVFGAITRMLHRSSKWRDFIISFQQVGKSTGSGATHIVVR